MSTNLEMTAPPDAYRKRRKALASALQRPLVLFVGHPKPRNYANNTFPFRPDGTYAYFGGPPIEGAAWLIEPGSDGVAGSTLLRTVGGFEDVVWMGEVPTDAQLADAAGVPESSLKTPDQLTALLRGRTAGAVMPWCFPTREFAAKCGLQAHTPEETAPIVELRLRKDEHELKAMRRAAAIGVEAHTAAIKTAGPGRTEAEVSAALHCVYLKHRSFPSFTPTVSIHGEALHSGACANTMRGGELLLIDAGAEEPGGYASDITRTVPVSGKFTPIQRQMYDTVLRAQRAAIAACVPGKRYREIHDLAAKVICEGLVDAKLLRGDGADLASRGVHTLFFTHGLGHLIGLEVHDMEDFGDLAGYAPGRKRRPEFGNKYLRFDRDLEPGIAVTIEPGVYFVPALWAHQPLVERFADCVNRSEIDKLLASHFGGIRIEDTIVVRDAKAVGPEVLTSALPTDADDIAALTGAR